MKFRLQFWPTVLAVPALVVIVGLGNWQVERLYWKEDLIRKVEEQISQTPVALPDRDAWETLDIADAEYRRFAARGRFDHGHEFHVFTSLSNPKGRFKGPGYWVITPFVLAEGGTVMVNRGFVPDTYKAPENRPLGQVEGERKIVGLLRKPETQEMFVPDNDLAKNVWYYRDLSAMAVEAGRNDVAPFLLDETANNVTGGLPQAGETRLAFKNDHLQYAVTWYGIALCLLGVYFAYHISYNRKLNAQRSA